MEDSEIVELFWKRDQDAIVQTDLAYGSMCRGLSRRILKNSEDAEECVNDSYYRLWERLPPERPRHLGSFLARIVRNLSLNRLRELTAMKRGGGAIALALDELQTVCGVENVESTVTARELGQAVDRFLRTQPERSRGIFLRRYFYLESRLEIAERFGVSAAQVSVILSRTRKRLREYLTKEGLL